MESAIKLAMTGLITFLFGIGMGLHLSNRNFIDGWNRGYKEHEKLMRILGKMNKKEM